MLGSEYVKFVCFRRFGWREAGVYEEFLFRSERKSIAFIGFVVFGVLERYMGCVFLWD